MAKINSDRLSLFTLVSGPRGSQKTLMMSSFVCERLIKAYLLEHLRSIKTSVWTNYPVRFMYNSPIEGHPIKLESIPLNMEAFYTFDEGLRSGWVFIDEMDQWYDRQDWQSVTQKLMNSVMTQIRKRKLSMMGTVQDANWINSRGQFQVDITAQCRESAFTAWGRKCGLDLGEAAFVTWRDKSGVMTGYQYEETKRDYRQIFRGRRYWNTFDTNYEFNPLETKTKYTLKRNTKVIDMTGAGNGLLEETDYVDPLKSARKNEHEVLLADLIEDLKLEGRTEITKNELWSAARERGFNADLGTGGKILAGLNVGQNRYKFYIPGQPDKTLVTHKSDMPPIPQKQEKKKLPLKKVNKIRVKAEV